MKLTLLEELHFLQLHDRIMLLQIAAGTQCRLSLPLALRFGNK